MIIKYFVRTIEPVYGWKDFRKRASNPEPLGQ